VATSDLSLINLVVSETTLTSSDIKTLDYVPVTLIPAPGARKAIFVTGVNLQTIAGTTPYNSGNGDGLHILYAGMAIGSKELVTQDEATNPFLTTAGSQVFPWPLIMVNPGTTPAANIYTFSQIANRAVQIENNTGHSYNNGGIITATLHAGGSGYAVNDTGIIDPGSFGSNADATYKVLTVSGGAVVTFQVTAAGTNYQLCGGGAGDPNVNFGNGPGAGYLTGTGGGQPGVGTGFTVNVTAVSAGDYTLAATVYYQVVTLQ
jgi:hypothetical protein